MKPRLTPDEAQEIARKGLENPSYFYRTFFPQWFPLPMPWVHRGLLAILTGKTDWLLDFGEERWPGGAGVWDGEQLDKILRHFRWRAEPEDEQSPLMPLFEGDYDGRGRLVALHLRTSNKTLVIMPRGMSKTTIVNAHVLYKIVYLDSGFIVYLSEASPHSELQVDTVKRELEQNSLLQLIYGNKQPLRSDSEHWGSKLIETTDGTTVLPRGRGSQVRGLNHKGRRPDYIIFDDVEDKDSVKTDDQRLKARTWMKADVEPALPHIEGARAGSLMGLGTIIHPDSLLVNLSRDPEWITVRFGATDPDGDMLWSHYMTREQYERKLVSFARIGSRAEFYMEYESETRIAGLGAKFPTEFTYERRDPKDFPARAISIDPAISDQKDSDYCAFGVVGMDGRGKIHVFDVYLERGMDPRRQVDKYFELALQWKCTRHGVEAISYQRALVHLLKEEMFRRAKFHGNDAYFEITPITHGRVGKRERVEGVLSPRYLSGYVTHDRRFPEYEVQLLDWPSGKKDGPDVVAQAITLLDPFAALAYDPENEDEHKLEKDMFEPLDHSYFATVP